MQANDKPTLLVESTNETFPSFIERPHVDLTSYDRLGRANTLMIPNEGYGDRMDLVYFPSGTSDLFQFLEANRPDQLLLDASIEERHYKEIALHADWVNLASFVVTHLVAPLLINLLAQYVVEVVGDRASKSKVRSRVTIVDEVEQRSVRITYEGPADAFRDSMRQALRQTRGSPTGSGRRKRQRRRK